MLENFDDTVVTVGSGGSVSGIAIGNYLTGSKPKYALNRYIDIFFIDCGRVITYRPLSDQSVHYAQGPNVSQSSLS